MQLPLVRTAVAFAVFLVAWALLHYGFYTRDQIIDTPIYERPPSGTAGRRRTNAASTA
jgi:hypothetical protein